MKTHRVDSITAASVAEFLAGILLALALVATCDRFSRERAKPVPPARCVLDPEREGVRF